MRLVDIDFILYKIRAMKSDQINLLLINTAGDIYITDDTNVYAVSRASLHSGASFETVDELIALAKFSVSIHTDVKLIADSDLKLCLQILQTFNTAGDLKMDGVVIAIPKQAIGVKTKYNGKHYCKMFISPIVIPKTFYGGLLSPLTLKFTAKSKVDSAINKAIKIAIQQNTFADTNIGTALHKAVESVSEHTMELLLQTITASHIEVYGSSQLFIVSTAKEGLAVNTQHKQSNNSQLRTIIMVLGRARLVDYASYSLQQLNLRTLQEMKYKGE